MENNEIIKLKEQDTIQDLLGSWYEVEAKIKNLIYLNVGLSHITDLYIEVLELEKEECRKALVSFCEDTEEYKRYLKLI